MPKKINKILEEQILAKYNYKCQLCNSTCLLRVHHKNYFNIGEEKDDDIILLCNECYKKFHNIKE